MRKSDKSVFLALMLLIFGVILDLVMIFGGAFLSHILTLLLEIVSAIFTLISVFIIIRNLN